MWVYGLVYQLRHHHCQCAVLDLGPTVSCQFGKNRIHFLPVERKDIWNEAVCPFRVLAHQVEPSRAPSGSTAPSCGAGRKIRQKIQCLKVKDVGIKNQKKTPAQLAGVFYNVKNGSSFIKSKSLSENLSKQN
jgi:hypothetical protein